MEHLSWTPSGGGSFVISDYSLAFDLHDGTSLQTGWVAWRMRECNLHATMWLDWSTYYVAY